MRELRHLTLTCRPRASGYAIALSHARRVQTYPFVSYPDVCNAPTLGDRSLMDRRETSDSSGRVSVNPTDLEGIPMRKIILALAVAALASWHRSDRIGGRCALPAGHGPHGDQRVQRRHLRPHLRLTNNPCAAVRSPAPASAGQSSRTRRSPERSPVRTSTSAGCIRKLPPRPRLHLDYNGPLSGGARTPTRTATRLRSRSRSP